MPADFVQLKCDAFVRRYRDAEGNWRPHAAWAACVELSKVREFIYIAHVADCCIAIAKLGCAAALQNDRDDFFEEICYRLHAVCARYGEWLHQSDLFNFDHERLYDEICNGYQACIEMRDQVIRRAS